MYREGIAGGSSDVSFDGVHSELTERIIGCAFRVHNALGCGFVEAVYEGALAIEFEREGIAFGRQVGVEVKYAGQAVGLHRLDLLADGKVIVELKAKEAFTDADIASVLSYLKATNLRIALLLNFGTPRLKVKRLGNIEPRIKEFPKLSDQSD